MAVPAWVGDEPSRCERARDRLTGAWDDQRRGDIERALIRTEVSYAPQVWERTESDVDRYAEQWVELHTEACESAEHGGQEADAVLDLRMQCLRRARAALAAATEVLADADAKVVPKVHEVAAGLPPLDRCADLAALTSDVERLRELGHAIAIRRVVLVGVPLFHDEELCAWLERRLPTRRRVWSEREHRPGEPPDQLQRRSKTG